MTTQPGALDMNANHNGMNAREAQHLEHTLEPLLPEHGLSSVPWDREDGEWIVTVWSKDQEGSNADALVDIFDLQPGYTCRTVDKRAKAFAPALADIPQAVRAALRRRAVMTASPTGDQANDAIDHLRTDDDRYDYTDMIHAYKAGWNDARRQP